MELRRRRSSPTAKASDALPLPLHVTNAFFFTLFFSLAYYLLHRWRDKMRSSSPFHLLSLSDIAAIFALFASVIYLLGFFGIHFVQSFVARPADEEPSHASPLDGIKDSDTDNDNGNENDNDDLIIADSIVRGGPHSSPSCRADSDISVRKGKDKRRKQVLTSEPVSSLDRVDDDNLIVDSVIDGTVPSYSLESRLGDCRRAAAIRREVLQRGTGRSLVGLPLDGFDYDTILGQCCEMPVGYVQLPVGVAGPLLLDGAEYTVPMATTEGCLVASTNRGCKAIYASGGASSVVLKDGMSRAPVVRFATASRAAELKFFLEDPLNFDTLAVIFNRSFSYLDPLSVVLSYPVGK